MTIIQQFFGGGMIFWGGGVGGCRIFCFNSIDVVAVLSLATWRQYNPVIATHPKKSFTTDCRNCIFFSDSASKQNSELLGQPQDLDKPSPPQKPLPADPLGRSARLGHGAAALGLHVPGRGPLPVPIPTVPKPPPAIPFPSRLVRTSSFNVEFTWI